MGWPRSANSHLGLKTSQVIQTSWLVFSMLAVGLAVAGIPHYLDFLRSPCIIPNCLGMQMSEEAVRAWITSGLDLPFYANIQMLVTLILDSLLVLTAVYLIAHKSNNSAGVLAAFVGVALATNTLAQAEARINPHFTFPALVISYVEMAGLFPLFCLFPDGVFRPRWMHWVALGYILLSLVSLFPQHREWLAPGSPFYPPWLAFMILSGLVVLANLVLRLRRVAGTIQYEQMLWIFAGIVLALPVVLSDTSTRSVNAFLSNSTFLQGDPSGFLFGMFFAVGSFTCILVGLVNYEPMDGRTIISRTLVFAMLTAFIVGAYGLIVGYLSTVFHSENPFFSLIATGLIAILFQPLRERLQRGVNRMMYGRRDEPYQVLTLLGQQLSSAIDPASAISLTVETVARSLKLPYVAITFKREGQFLPVASFGKIQTGLTLFPLIYAGEIIGELETALRSPHEPFSEADQRLLSDLAQQISVTVHAAQLAADLQSIRLRIVEANEETRRQIGNDLHDGVGHQLAGLARKTEQAVLMLEREPEKVPDTLIEMKQHLNTIISQVRTLAHQLHPPELEVLGLIGAIREQCQTFTGFTIRLEVAEEFPHLPAAIETAAYYIALEALTNIEKHAHARSCLMRFSLSRHNPGLNLPVLEIEISDDGLGLPLEKPAGLGLLSMQGRAIEVGGSCQVTSNQNGGTRVLVCLPLRSLDSGV